MQVGIFLVIGVASTLAYALLYLGLRSTMTPWWANFTALLATAVVNTAANRRFTFGVKGPRNAMRHQVQGLVIFAGGLAVTSGALALLHALGSTSRGVEVVVLTAANLGVTVLRFVGMRLWVFAHRPVGAEPSLSARAVGPGSPGATLTGSAAARRE
jgi:putative flippase GtrA